jgi:hypothetical protein
MRKYETLTQETGVGKRKNTLKYNKRKEVFYFAKAFIQIERDA